MFSKIDTPIPCHSGLAAHIRRTGICINNYPHYNYRFIISLYSSSTLSFTLAIENVSRLFTLA